MKFPPFSTPAVYAISPEFESDAELFAWAESLLQSPCPILQYRDKTHTAPQKLARAKVLREITKSHNTIFIINDSVLLALKSNADGVHLGKNDGSLFLARQLLGDSKIIGASCYASLKNAERAQQMGADYVAFGAVFPSPTKPDAPAVPLSRIALAKMALNIPVCAIGGITIENAAQVLKSGVDLIAISHALLDSPKESVDALQPLLSQRFEQNDDEH